MQWSPDMCRKGQCRFEVRDWDTADADALEVCGAHAHLPVEKVFAEVWAECAFKEQARTVVATALRIETSEVVWTVDDEHNYALTVPGLAYDERMLTAEVEKVPSPGTVVKTPTQTPTITVKAP